MTLRVPPHILPATLIGAAVAAAAWIGISSGVMALRPPGVVERVEQSVARVRTLPLESGTHSPWVVAHAAIAFGNADLVALQTSGQQVGAVDYLLNHARTGGKRIYELVEGRPRLPEGRFGNWVETHRDQFLMVYALAGISRETVVLFEGGVTRTIGDLVSAAADEFDPAEELGWTLVALTAYGGPGFSWTSPDGENWSIERLLQAAIRRDPRWETEGGTHHLFGVAYARRHYAGLAGASPQVLRDVDAYLSRYIDMSRQFQQEDGAFSVAMLRGPAAPRNVEQLVWSTGHTLEWLVLALDPSEVRAPWIEKAVLRLTDALDGLAIDGQAADNPFRFSQLGSVYHAVNALKLYADARTADSEPAGRPVILTSSGQHHEETGK